jgi:hypothetical protein
MPDDNAVVAGAGVAVVAAADVVSDVVSDVVFDVVGHWTTACTHVVQGTMHS